MGGTMHPSRRGAGDRVIDWLLERDQPAIRYRALTELLGRPLDDPEVREARGTIPKVGWARAILAERNPAGWWVRDWSHFSPSFISTTWMMLVLSSLGLDREFPEIRESCELWMRMKPLRYGPILHPSVEPHYCSLGFGTEALIRFGYGDDPRVRRSLDWIVKKEHPEGGWSHFGSGRNLDAWEGLAALAALPRSHRTAAMQRAANLGAEFYLDRELHRQGPRHAPWYRFHDPVFYFYDVLVGLEMITALGYGEDPRLRFALNLLKRKRRADGRWNLDAIRPESLPQTNDKAFALERVGAASKMITLRALIVLSRLN